MTRNDALQVIIATMIGESKTPPVLGDLLKKFSQTTIQVYSYEITRLLWKMENEGLITIQSGIIFNLYSNPNEI